MNDPRPATDEAFLTRPMWFGISRWGWVRISFLFVVLVGTLSLWQVQRNGEQDRRRDAEITADIARDGCQQANVTRRILLDVVELSLNSTLDLTAVPGFDDLDPATQAFFINIRQLQDENRNAPDSFAAEARRVLAPIDCAAGAP